MVLQWLGSRGGLVVSSGACAICISNTAKVWRAEGHSLINKWIPPNEPAFYFSVGLCIVFLGLYGAAMSIRLLRVGLSRYLAIPALICILAPFAPWIPITIPVAAAYLIAALFGTLHLYLCLKK
jgi:hypothetical protein